MGEGRHQRVQVGGFTTTWGAEKENVEGFHSEVFEQLRDFVGLDLGFVFLDKLF
jgi:hypothetical protein